MRSFPGPAQAAWLGSIHGATWGFCVSLAYIAVYFLLGSLARFQTESLTLGALLAELPFGILLFAIYGGLYGVLPASIIGALTGAIVGAVLSLLPMAPSRRTTTFVAYIVAIAIAALASAAFLILTPDTKAYPFWIGIPAMIYLVAAYPWSLRFHNTLFSRRPHISAPTSRPAA